MLRRGLQGADLALREALRTLAIAQEAGGQTANLLVPLYLVIAAGAWCDSIDARRISASAWSTSKGFGRYSNAPP